VTTPYIYRHHDACAFDLAGGTMLTIRVLGTVDVTIDARPVPLPLRPRGLLAMLAIADGRAVTVEQALDGIWGENAPVSARNALQVYMSTLRRALGPEAKALRKVPGGYALAGGTADVDVVRFRELIAHARDGGPRSALREATDLWRGPPLADVDELPFVAPTVVRLTEEWLLALEQRIDEDLDGDRPSLVVPELETLLSDHPYREGLWQRLALALYRSGRQADALNALERARRTLRDDLGLDPGVGLRSVEGAILRQDPAIDARSNVRPRVCLPAPPVTGLVGREDELARLEAVLRDRRLVTLTGPGGVGKTRLAIEAAARLAGGEIESCAFVDLSDVMDPSLVASEIARCLGVAGSDSWAAVARELARAPTLLVIDNVEQVATEIGPTLAHLVRNTLGLKVLLTSRVPLRVADEHVLPLAPLDPRAAAELFVQRANAARPDASLRSDALAKLCRLLDGLPLAIELAAARCRIMSPEQMLRRFDEIISADVRSSGLVLDRHRSVHRSVTWSVDLLTPSAREVLSTLGVFSSAANLNDVEAVVGRPSLGAMEELVDANLVIADGDAFRLLETVRVVARELLSARRDVDDVRLRHASWAAGVAESITASTGRADRVGILMRARLEDVLAAVDFLSRSGRDEQAARLLLLTAPAWSTQRSEAELDRSLYWLTRVGEGRLSRETEIRVLLHQQDRLFFSGRGVESRAAALRAYELAKQDGFSWGVARACHALAYRAMLDKAYPLGRALCAEGLTAVEWADDPLLRANFYNVLGCIETAAGDYDAAVLHLRTFLDAAGAIDASAKYIGLANLVEAALAAGLSEDAAEAADELWLAIPAETESAWDCVALGAQGLVALARARHRRAAAEFARSLDVRVADGYALGLALEVVGIARVAAYAGDRVMARTLLSMTRRLRESDPAVRSEWTTVTDAIEGEVAAVVAASADSALVRVNLGTVDGDDWHAVATFAAGVGHRLAAALGD
jgi:predicted ATPase/DNA-binding SARP family transcriptional activator